MRRPSAAASGPSSARGGRSAVSIRPASRSASRRSRARQASRASSSTPNTQLRGEIERLRAAHLEIAEPVPTVQRATDASLRARNQTLLDENRRLRAEVAGLREELAGAWGELRALGREHRRTGPGTASS